MVVGKPFHCKTLALDVSLVKGNLAMAPALLETGEHHSRKPALPRLSLPPSLV